MILPATLTLVACSMVAVMLVDRTVRGCGNEKILLGLRDAAVTVRNWGKTGPASDGPVPTERQKFVINGWRWHTMSAIRDLERFSRVVEHLLSVSHNATSCADLTAEATRLSGCHDFVFNFNIAGLHRVESELIAPFLRVNLPESVWPQLDDLLQSHAQVSECSKQISWLCDSLVASQHQWKGARHSNSEDGAQSHVSLPSRQLLIKSMSEWVRRACGHIVEIKSMQESFFVPFIASHLEPDAQEVLNRRVVSTLGLLDAQVHLASMREVIDGDPFEIELFRTHLPAVVHRLMPFWRHMYASRTRCLEG